MVTTENNWVSFRFFRPQARQVLLAGDFNGWGAQPLPMRRTEEGYWVAAMRLPAGDYGFQYEADGQSFLDYAAFGLDFSPYGPHSMVLVPPASLNTVSDGRRVA